MKKQMKNMTYRNLMTVIHRLEAKGYDSTESERMARRIFEDFAANPLGMSIESRIDRILTKEEWEAEDARYAH